MLQSVCEEGGGLGEARREEQRAAKQWWVGWVMREAGWVWVDG